MLKLTICENCGEWTPKWRWVCECGYDRAVGKKVAKMVVFFVMFEDGTKIKIDRPESVKHKDGDICNRAYELVKGDKGVDDWTEKMDRLFERCNIKYKKADEKEFEEYYKKANEAILRL